MKRSMRGNRLMNRLTHNISDRPARSDSGGKCQGTCRLDEFIQAALSNVLRVSFRSVLLGFK